MARTLIGRTAPAVAVALMVAWACIGRAQPPGVAERAGDRVGETLDDAGRAIKRGLHGAGESVRAGFARTRTAVHDMELSSRIYSRLHWDKALTRSTLEVEVQAGGVAFVRGVVPDMAAKRKALLLTADTVGVVQVVDQLTALRPDPEPSPGARPAPSSTIPSVGP